MPIPSPVLTTCTDIWFKATLITASHLLDKPCNTSITWRLENCKICEFAAISHCISNRSTIEYEYEVTCGLPNCVISNDLEWLLIQISRSQYFWNQMSKVVQDRTIATNWTLIGSRMQSVTQCHFYWPWMSHNLGFMVMVLFKSECYSKWCIFYCPTADYSIMSNVIRYTVAMWYDALLAIARSQIWILSVAAVCQCQLSLSSLWGQLMSTSDSWRVNEHTMQCIYPIIGMVLRPQETKISAAIWAHEAREGLYYFF